MLLRRDAHLHRTFWALADQAVVSLGVFAGQILLARHVRQADYGSFALLFGGALTLQLVTATLLFYPLSVRLVVAAADDRDRLLGASLVLIGLLSGGLGLLLAAILLVLGQYWLILPSLVWFLLWQTQEAMRRGLLSQLKPQQAVLGDTITYLGQAALLAYLAHGGHLTVVSALYGMALTSLLGTIAHTVWLGPRVRGPLALRSTLIDYVSIGAFGALTNGILANVRVLVLPWVLAIGAGPAATAAYQAATNIINASNPVMIGLGNVIPQATSQSSTKGLGHAWRTVLKYGLLGGPMIMIYSVAILVYPAPILRLLYGASSEYNGLALAVRLLIVANLVGVATEFVVWFLHGIRAVQQAVRINGLGAIASCVLIGPLVAVHGLTGGCLAMIGVNGVRLLLAHRIVRVMTRRSCV